MLAHTRQGLGENFCAAISSGVLAKTRQRNEVCSPFFVQQEFVEA